MLDLLAAVRALRTALENPAPDPDFVPDAETPLNPFTVIPLSEQQSDEINAVFVRALDKPDALPIGVEMKLTGLLPVWNLLRYINRFDEANQIRRGNLNTVREIEFVLNEQEAQVRAAEKESLELVVNVTGDEKPEKRQDKPKKRSPKKPQR